jgi:hypothetical protein
MSRCSSRAVLLGVGLLLAGCGAPAAPVTPEPVPGGSALLTIRMTFLPVAAPFRLLSIPGGTASVTLTLENASALQAPLTASVAAPAAGGAGAHTFSGLRPGVGYRLRGRAIGATGVTLAEGGEVSLLDDAGEPRHDALGRPLTAETFTLAQGANAARLQLAIAPLTTTVVAE